jgi:hypothetical protein
VANDKAAQSVATNSNFPILTSPEWLKSIADAPVRFYAMASKEALGLTASWLQDQADCLNNLAECSDPAEAFTLQCEFAQKSWIRSAEQA